MPAKAARSQVELRDPHANYNKMDMETLKKSLISIILPVMMKLLLTAVNKPPKEKGHHAQSKSATCGRAGVSRVEARRILYEAHRGRNSQKYDFL